jgi:FKBP-type peptidyl-prolyl cis-trans isomerase (trigger factor)
MILLEKSLKQAEEEKRKAAIERAMLEMERAELEAAKESKKPELGKSCKLFFITAQIKLRCEPTATKEDAEKTLKEIIYESHGEVVKIEKIIGE